MTDTPNYRVVDQERDTAVGLTGSVERGWRVYFLITGMSNPADVFIPDSSYSADNARTLIQHEVDRVLAVHNLGG